MSLLCVMQLRNEAYYLPGCLAHLRPFVDGIVALDDGSDDSTAALLAAESAVVDVLRRERDEGDAAAHRWREPENRARLLGRAVQAGARWVLVCDADERYERAFLERLRDLVAELDGLGCQRTVIRCRELWDRPDQYRVDGVWGFKTRGRLFRLPGEIDPPTGEQLHGQWEPREIRAHKPYPLPDHCFYHLKMIRRADRIARRDFYNRVDPERRHQPSGYDYLTDEDGLQVEPIAPGREYDYATLPADLAAMLAEPAAPRGVGESEVDPR